MLRTVFYKTGSSYDEEPPSLTPFHKDCCPAARLPLSKIWSVSPSVSTCTLWPCLTLSLALSSFAATVLPTTDATPPSPDRFLPDETSIALQPSSFSLWLPHHFCTPPPSTLIWVGFLKVTINISDFCGKKKIGILYI